SGSRPPGAADAVTRQELAEHTCRIFDLDPDLLRTGRVPEAARLPAPVPFDTSLSTPRTDEILGVRPHGIDAQLRALRDEVATGRPQPTTPHRAGVSMPEVRIPEVRRQG